jgi:hypothetical protein
MARPSGPPGAAPAAMASPPPPRPRSSGANRRTSAGRSNCRARGRHADRLGRPRVRSHRHPPGGRGRLEEPPPLHRHGAQPQGRFDRLAAHGREEAPHEGTHNQFGTMASASAVTDGEHVIASFESRGIFAYDMNGKPAWQIDLGDKRMRNEFGEGSTPALYKDRLFVVWDHLGQSFITALDKRTGQGGLADRPRRDRQLGDAARRRARRPRAGRDLRHEPDAQLRRRDRQDRLGRTRASRCQSRFPRPSRPTASST